MDSEAPLFSVCICTYDDADTIDAHLDSVLPQTDERFEVVVVDGGSTDGTTERIRDRADETPARVRLVEQTGSGIGQARQQCVEVAEGKYLLEQVDADMIYAECFEPLLAFYLETVEAEGPLQLQTHGLRITPRELHAELGGWRPFPYAFEDNELTRRFVGAGKYRLLDVRVGRHPDPGNDFPTAFRRYLYNNRERFRSGLSPLYALSHLFRSDLPAWRKVMDVGTIAATYLWGLPMQRFDTFDPADPLAYETFGRLLEGSADGTYEGIRLQPTAEIVAASFENAEDKTYSYTNSSL
jgi:glycosyltransferase involved in cell wall biosynthesis